MSLYKVNFSTLDLSEVVETLDDQLDTRINIQLVPKRHGGLVSEVPVAQPRKIRMKGRIQEADHDTLRSTLDTVARILNSGRQKLRFRDDRYLNAYKNSFGFGYVPGTAMASADFLIEFLCDDPFVYTDSTFSSTYNLTSADVVVDITNNRYKKAFTINNTGTAYSFIKVTTTANQGSAVVQTIVRNNTTGRNEQYNGTIALNKALVMDNGAFTVKNDGTEDYVNWVGNFLWLDPGNNSIEIEGTPATYLIEFSPRYW